MTERASIASDLEALLSGALNVNDFRHKYDSRVASPLLEAIWGNLLHYLADADLRAKDDRYNNMQNGELRKLIQLLREDAPIAHLRRVTFLAVT